MRVEVVTLFPDMVRMLLGFGVTGRAAERGLLQVGAWNPREAFAMQLTALHNLLKETRG